MFLELGEAQMRTFNLKIPCFRAGGTSEVNSTWMRWVYTLVHTMNGATRVTYTNEGQREMKIDSSQTIKNMQAKKPCKAHLHQEVGSPAARFPPARKSQ